MTKAALRSKYKALRKKLSVEEVDRLSLQIANQCLDLPIWDRNYYHLFLPIVRQKEVNTEFLLHILQGRDKSVVISKSDFNYSLMTHYLLEEHTTLKTSKFGIPEPVDGLEVPAKAIDVVFVPLLAFDQNGARLGYGKGFYDRFLGQCKDSAVFVGLSFFPAEPQIPEDQHDVRLHHGVTPVENYSF